MKTKRAEPSATALPLFPPVWHPSHDPRPTDYGQKCERFGCGLASDSFAAKHGAMAKPCPGNVDEDAPAERSR